MNLMIILTLVLLTVVFAQLLAPKWVASEVSQNSSDIGMWIVGTIFAAMMAIGIIYAALQGSFTNYGNRLKDTSTKIDPGTWGK
ncbi:hypothetical protein MKY22_17155 [Exiguobacterium sp. FSL W8-0210]|uniref:hypothetical protein n=1 Tax=Exiguobacterium sp. FSL W8-0210 TaxID=2921598 RepID=UPI0030F9F0F3